MGMQAGGNDRTGSAVFASKCGIRVCLVVKSCAATRSVNRTCRPLLAEQPVHPGYT